MEVRDFVHQQQAKHWMQGAVIHPIAQGSDASGGDDDNISSSGGDDSTVVKPHPAS